MREIREIEALVRGFLQLHLGAWTLLATLFGLTIVVALGKLGYAYWASREVIPTVGSGGEPGTDEGDAYAKDGAFQGGTTGAFYHGAAGGYGGSDDRVGDLFEGDDHDGHN